MNQQAQLVLDPLSNQCNSRRAGVTRLEIQNGAYRCVQDSLERYQCGSWKTGQHGVAIVQTRHNGGDMHFGNVASRLTVKVTTVSFL